MSHFLNRILPLSLAILALVWGQIFGFQCCYIAEIDGKLVITAASHHHKGDTLESGHFVDYTPHEHDAAGTNALVGDCAATGCHSDPANHGSDTQLHVPVKVQPELTQLLPSVNVPPLVLFTLDDLPDFLLIREALANTSSANPPPLELDRSPPAALLVAQCVVLLV